VFALLKVGWSKGLLDAMLACEPRKDAFRRLVQ
jgi:hypothetical protein